MTERISLQHRISIQGGQEIEEVREIRETTTYGEWRPARREDFPRCPQCGEPVMVMGECVITPSGMFHPECSR